MKPLPWIAMGFVIILLTADAGGWDLLPDPAGWVVVLVGIRAMPTAWPLRTSLCVLAGMALLVSAATWVPPLAERLDDADPALAWTVGLAQLGFVALLAHVLAGVAIRADDSRAARWWAVTRTVTILVGLLPVLVFGGGIDALADVAGVVTILAPLLVVVLLFAHGSRPWAAA